MRPVNLIPADERRGTSSARTGPVAYILVGVLVAALAGVASLVLTGNRIIEREAETARLEDEKLAAQARADSLRAFAEFASVQEARTQTVASLAKSRFDWERVMRELALVIPDDVWLTDLTGTVSPDIELESDDSAGLRDQVSGPALALVGCGAGHESVARFVAALRDIDGVTRVALSVSELPGEEAATEEGTSSSGDSCQIREFISRFEITVAFDGVTVPESGAEGAPEGTVPPAPTDEAPQVETAATASAVPEG